MAANPIVNFETQELWRLPGNSIQDLARSRLALVAHDHKKIQLVDLAICYRDILVGYRLVATATTGKMLHDMVGLEVECLRSGLGGGDRQIADSVAAGGVAAVIFLIDPFTRRPYEPEVGAVMRVCNIHDIPIATNLATATALLNSVSLMELYAAGSQGSLEDKYGQTGQPARPRQRSVDQEPGQGFGGGAEQDLVGLAIDMVAGEHPQGGAQNRVFGLVPDVPVLGPPGHQRGAAFGEIENVAAKVLPGGRQVGLFESLEGGPLGLMETLRVALLDVL
jgi:methylglyoxal synthase